VRYLRRVIQKPTEFRPEESAWRGLLIGTVFLLVIALLSADARVILAVIALLISQWVTDIVLTVVNERQKGKQDERESR
jgi:hypothetical protein